MIQVAEVKVRWVGVSGATGYEVRKDGVVVGTRGKLARTTSIKVDDKTVVEIIDLPTRSVTQTVDFSQGS